MAICTVIDERNYRPGINEIGDIISVYEDDQKFPEGYEEKMNIVSIPGTKAEVLAKIPEQKEMWKDDQGVWKELVKQPKYALRFENGEVKENFSRIPENDLSIVNVIK